MINPTSLRITATNAIEINNIGKNCYVLDIRSNQSKQQSNWKISNSVGLEASREEVNFWAESIDKNNWVFLYCA
ncbi:MAG: hypothetical protein EBT92_01620 [Planctomycetes bacterium]|nr:hypothetical protein [Planctomycetota bacterium]NBY03482.1 hypothetical protein [Planctomycetota bacterium]